MFVLLSDICTLCFVICRVAFLFPIACSGRWILEKVPTAQTHIAARLGCCQIIIRESGVDHSW